MYEISRKQNKLTSDVSQLTHLPSYTVFTVHLGIPRTCLRRIVSDYSELYEYKSRVDLINLGSVYWYSYGRSPCKI